MISLGNLWKTSFESKKKATCGKVSATLTSIKFMACNCWSGYSPDALLQKFEDSRGSFILPRCIKENPADTILIAISTGSFTPPYTCILEVSPIIFKIFR